MKKILCVIAIVFLISGCVTINRDLNVPSKQKLVLSALKIAGFAVDALKHEPKIVKVDNCAHMPCDSLGCFDMSDHTIYVCTDAPKVLIFELGRYYLTQLHVPVVDQTTILQALF